MKWTDLFNKIGRQPLKFMKHEDVTLKTPEGDCYLLKLVYTDSGNKLHLELDKKVED